MNKDLLFDGEFRLSDGRILHFERFSLFDLNNFFIDYNNVDQIILEVSK